MQGTEQDVRKIKEKILAISKGNKLSTFSPARFYNSDLCLDRIARKIANKENPPVILWNVLPWNYYNVLHAVYCQKIKECIDIGFNCVVILYDKLIEKRIRFPEGEKFVIRKAVENCIRRFKNAGLNEEKTEFLTESDLYSFIKSEEFLDKITSFGHLCDFDMKMVKREGTVSFIMDNLCEIYYESVVDCDVVLTGEVDMQKIWGGLRAQILDREIIKNYKPPLVLYYPTLKGTDGEPLSTTSDNSLSIDNNAEELRNRLEICQEEFLKTVLDFLIIPWNGKIVIEEHPYYSFEELKQNKITKDKISEATFDHVKEYFNNIRESKL